MFGQGQGAASLVAVVIDNYSSSGAHDRGVKHNAGLMTKLIVKENLNFFEALGENGIIFQKSPSLYLKVPTQRALNSI